MNTASDKAVELLEAYLGTRERASKLKSWSDRPEFGSVREAVADCRAARKELLDYIAELEAAARKLDTPVRRCFACPRCGVYVATEVDADGRATCPNCENEVTI